MKKRLNVLDKTLFFLKKNQNLIYSFSRSLRENESKEGRYPQGPLQRGMQTESRRNRRLSVGFGIAGHAMSVYIKVAHEPLKARGNIDTVVLGDVVDGLRG